MGYIRYTYKIWGGKPKEMTVWQTKM